MISDNFPERTSMCTSLAVCERKAPLSGGVPAAHHDKLFLFA
jgi:hypothetical protein